MLCSVQNSPLEASAEQHPPGLEASVPPVSAQPPMCGSEEPPQGLDASVPHSAALAASDDVSDRVVAAVARASGQSGGLRGELESLQACIDQEVEARFAREATIIKQELASRYKELEESETRRRAELEAQLRQMSEKNRALEEVQGQAWKQIEYLTAMLGGPSVSPIGAGRFGSPSFLGSPSPPGFGGCFWGSPGSLAGPPPAPPAMDVALGTGFSNSGEEQKAAAVGSGAKLLPAIPKFPVAEATALAPKEGGVASVNDEAAGPGSPRRTTFSSMKVIGHPPRFDPALPASSTPPPRPMQSPMQLTGASPTPSPNPSPKPVASGRPRAQTPQSRVPPQRENVCRAPWSLLGSPSPARSPQPHSLMNTPGLLQSPGVPQSPFVIMEDGGQQFSFSLRKADGVALGLDFDVEHSMLVVRGIHPGGAVEAWNRQCAGGPAAGKAVMVGDRVISANGVSDVESMLQECEEKQLVRLQVARDAPGELSAAPPLPPLAFGLGGFNELEKLGPPPGLGPCF